MQPLGAREIYPPISHLALYNDTMLELIRAAEIRSL